MRPVRTQHMCGIPKVTVDSERVDSSRSFFVRLLISAACFQLLLVLPEPWQYDERVMNPQLVIDRSAVKAFCQQRHITRLALFGSVLRDDFGPDSDVDVLVEFQPGHVPGLEFVSMERELSGLLQGRRVDLVTPKFLNARIREQVLREAQPLYVAA